MKLMKDNTHNFILRHFSFYILSNFAFILLQHFAEPTMQQIEMLDF